jgi:hypothetical protein
MLIQTANVADAIYTMYAKEHTKKDKEDLKPQQFVITAMEISDGDIFDLTIDGESFAYLCFAVLICSEELHESGVDLDADTHVGRAYKTLKSSGLENFLP